MEKVSIYGRHGNVAAAKGLREDSQSHVNRMPHTLHGAVIVAIHEFRDLSNAELLEIAFGVLRISDYGGPIIRAFTANTGDTLSHSIKTWYNFFSNKDSLIHAIKMKIIDNHHRFDYYGGRIDISKDIENNWPSFRVSFMNASEMIAIGGVQEVEITGKVLSERRGFDYWDRNGKIHNAPHEAVVEFEIFMKDWFGVDEDDFTNFRAAALLDRRGLAAMWVLQHQRGFHPFINIFKYKCIVKISLGPR